MWSAWLALLLMLSSSACGETVHYNQELLNTYARLSHQLRVQMVRSNTKMFEKFEEKKQAVLDMQTRISSAAGDANNILQAALLRLNLLLATAKVYTGRASAAAASDPFEDVDAPIFNDVRLDHGMDYSPVTGEITIRQSGVYRLEFKNQPKDHQAVSLKIDVVEPDGNKRYEFAWYTEWEVSPYFELLVMEAGDVLGIKSYRESSNLPPPSMILVPGPANMFTLHYLGQD